MILVAPYTKAVTFRITQRFVALRNKINENKGDHYNVDTAASVIFQHYIYIYSHMHRNLAE